MNVRPYKGLMPYSEEDAAFFFGREAEREIIEANLLASRLTLLYGPSGAGKSSVLRAGVAHHLRELARQELGERGTPEFVVVVFGSWRDDPLARLVSRIEDSIKQVVDLPPSFSFDSAQDRSSLPGKGERFAEALQVWTEQTGCDLLIILDQFEEYFLYHPQEDGEGTFAFEFPRAVNRPGLRANFLISIREDALAKLDRFKGRIAALFDNYLRIEHLDHEAARAAIEKPIEQYNRLHAEVEQVGIEPALVDAVLDQVRTGQVTLGDVGRGAVGAGLASVQLAPAHDQIETPYLQLVMTRLWDEEMRAGSRVLRLATLERLGGAERIVRTHLDEVMSALSADEQDVAARIFHHLVTPSGAKIAHTVPDLAEYAGVPQARLAPVLDKLSGPDVRVLRPLAPSSDQSQASRYEIFHDVLAPAILDWRARWARAQEQLEMERRLAQERAEKEEQLAFERKRVTQFRLWLAVVSVLLVAVAASAIYALGQQRIASSRELAAGAIAQLPRDPELSLLLATKAAEASSTTQAEDALRQALLESHVRAVMRGHQGAIFSAVFSPDGKQAVTAGEDGTARVWDTASGQPTAELRGHIGPVNSAAFSPSGRWIVTAGKDGSARVWEASTGIRVSELQGHEKEVKSAVFSPDGKFVATASLDGTARVWDAETARCVAILRDHTDGVRTAAFSPDGSLLVTASLDQTARVWQFSQGADSAGQVMVSPLAVLRGHTDQVRNATFSPDGKRVITSSLDKTARIWDARTGEALVELRGHEDWVFSAAFSPDGKLAVTASADGTARVWDTRTGTAVAVLRGHSEWVNTAWFAPDGKFVITAGDSTARLWEVDTWQNLAVLRGHTGAVSNAMFSPDGERIVTASNDGTARIWDAGLGRNSLELDAGSLWTMALSPDGKFAATASSDGTVLVWDVNTGQIHAGPFSHTSAAVYAVAFSPDGKFLVTASADRTARIWDLATGRGLDPLRGHTGEVVSAAFSPDGKWVVTASQDRTARVWETLTGRAIAELSGHTDGVRDAKFSPDGKYIVTASLDDTARVWEAVTGKTVAVLRGHTRDVYSAVFSPDGKLIVTASLDGTARVWEAATGGTVAVLREHTRDVYSAMFNRDGSQVLTASADGTARVWEARTGRSLVELRGHRGGVMTAAYSPDERWIVTAGQDATARIWNAATGQALTVFRGHRDWVVTAAFSPASDKRVVTGSADGMARIYACDVCGSIEDLLVLSRSRVTRPLTCQERQVYLHERVVCQ